jgi:hypothetical protein
MISPLRLQVLLPNRLEGRFVLSFKFIAIAYGMLGATAATGYMVQGGGGNGAAGGRTPARVAEAPKVERVAKLGMPPKPGLMPQVAMVATSQQDDSVAVPAPPPAMAVTPVTAAAAPSAMPLTAPPRHPRRLRNRRRAWRRTRKRPTTSLLKSWRTSPLKGPPIRVQAGTICRSQPT